MQTNCLTKKIIKHIIENLEIEFLKPYPQKNITMKYSGGCDGCVY